MIKAEKALEVLSDVVRGREGYVDPHANSGDDCEYAEFGQPSCIIGHVLDKFGVDVNQLWNGEIVEIAWNEPLVRNLGFTERAIRVLSSAQEHQDRGATWGKACEEAKEALTLSTEDDEVPWEPAGFEEDE